ncbi:histidine kinase [Sphingomonas naphthae]|uniref:Histidine kinase n=1 Tax=Sphingomonas naphthae TaxID=1813468 RepID=A0ABY7TH71_9SPHN|nr:histidine kinase [Sphingomonas naphthae]WCT72403.1 histidine kinase [Sphingomonas naphthae]
MASPLSARVSPRVALISIVGFWLFYYAIATARALAMTFENRWEMAGWRLLVGVIGIAVTYGLYLILRCARSWSLTKAILLALVICAPAALIYSSANWYVFYKLRTTPHETVVIRHPTEAKTVRIEDKTMTISVGTDGDLVDEKVVDPLGMIADTTMNGYFFLVAWCAFYFALAYAAAVREVERAAAGYQAAARAAELRALRYQVNPHFLFNTLNSLSSLVLQNRSEKAEAMIQNLAAFFRTSLTVDATTDVTLAEEIALQRQYLEIEAVRFRDRLIVAIDIPPSLEDACVPGLILQPLVENAIKYGVSRTTRPVTISVSATEDARGLVLSVRDDADPGIGAELLGMPGTGVGLANVRERLAARHGDAASCHHGPLSSGGYSVVLTMPLVRNGC